MKNIRFYVPGLFMTRLNFHFQHQERPGPYAHCIVRGCTASGPETVDSQTGDWLRCSLLLMMLELNVVAPRKVLTVKNKI